MTWRPRFDVLGQHGFAQRGERVVGAAEAFEQVTLQREPLDASDTDTRREQAGAAVWRNVIV